MVQSTTSFILNIPMIFPLSLWTLFMVEVRCVGRSDWTLSVDVIPDTEPVSLYRLGSTLSGIIRG